MIYLKMNKNKYIKLKWKEQGPSNKEIFRMIYSTSNKSLVKIKQ